MTIRTTLRPRSASALAGSRSPQISDGIFEGATIAAVDPPSEFTALAWGPDGFPGIEIWCYRNDNTVTGIPGNFGPTFVQAGNGPVDTLWLSKIPVVEEFIPPTGSTPDSDEAAEALKVYASTRWHSKYGSLDEPSNWEVSVSRPFAATSVPAANRIAFNKVYAVFQGPLAGGEEYLTSWVWVAANIVNGVPVPAGREIWLHYDPNELGGYKVPGMIPAGQSEEYLSTRLRLEEWMPDPPEMLYGWMLEYYPLAIADFKAHAMLHPLSPAFDPDQLVVVDYRTDALR